MSLFPGFFRKNSGEIARNRLKLLLVADKSNCSPEIVDMIKDDMIHVISRYVEIDSDGIELQMTQIKSPGQRGKIPALHADIPIRDIADKGIF